MAGLSGKGCEWTPLGMPSSDGKSAGGSDDLHLKKFAAPEADPTDDGQTMVIRRAAVATAAKVAPEEEDFEKEFGMPLAQMLGIVCHCYARGVFRSDDVAALIRNEKALREAFGRKLPDGPAVRRFRRRYADQLEETLETAYRVQAKDGEPETVFLQKKAAETIHDAAWTDNNRR